MDNRIIKTVKSRKRNPFLAALMSFLFIGAGQVYNGDLAKGCVLFLLRSIALIIIPLRIAGRDTGSTLLLFAFSLLFAAAVSIYSAVEAPVCAALSGNMPVKKYNTTPFYAGFASLNAALTLFLLIPAVAFFSIATVSDSTSSPLLKQGDRVLLSLPGPGGYSRADLVMYANGRISRIMGLEKDVVTAQGGFFEVNGTPVKPGIFTEQELSFFSLAHDENLFSEARDHRKYPVYGEQDDPDPVLKKYEPGSGAILLVRDNRKESGNPEIINTQSLMGRVEGVLCSEGMKRFLVRPFLQE